MTSYLKSQSIYYAKILLIFMLISSMTINGLITDKVSAEEIIQDDGKGAYINPDNNPVEYEDSIVSKEATYTGNPGEYFIDLTIEGKEVDPDETTDIVLVYDNSNSMAVNNRASIAQQAISSFVTDTMSNGNVQMGLVTFGADVFDGRENRPYIGVTYLGIPQGGPTPNLSYKGLTSTPEDITSLLPTDVPADRGYANNGGTFTQAALQEAEPILANSTADNRVILTITDGVPVFSEEPDGDLVGIEEDSLNDPNFEYSFYYDDNGTERTHGQWTIEEAQRIQSENPDYEMYSIGIEITEADGATEEEAIEVMEGIASSPNNYFDVSEVDELEEILSDFSSSTSNSIRNGIVTDPMGELFNLVMTDNEFIEASDETLSDGNYYLTGEIDGVSDPDTIQQLIEGVNVTVGESSLSDQTIQLDGLNLGEGEKVNLRYKVQLDTENENYSPDTYFPMNERTTLQPNENDSEILRDFLIPEALMYESAPVTVEHVDEDGNELAPPEALTGNVGEPYETQPAEIDGYELIETPDNATGEFTEEPQTVTYVYAPVDEETAHVTVEHVDEDGNELAPPEALTGNVGEPYETQPVEIDGYELIETPDNATGEFTEEPQTVTYVYAPVDEETAHVTVEHVDEDGNELAPSEALTGNVGEPYETQPAEIDGYELIETPDNATGEFTEEPQTVTYVYAPLENPATVTVEHVDEDGNELAPSEALTGNVGEPYETQPAEIDGYELIETPDNATGEFTEEPQTVTYVYAPLENPATVTVEHVDEDGNELAPSEALTGNVGEPYGTQPAEIDGYELIETPDNATGEFTEEPQTVTYVYAPLENPATVTVEHVDEDGNELAPSEALTGNVGEPYETQPAEIDGYELIETPDNATGEFTEEPQTVTYVYAPLENPATVTVEHVDEDGNELAPFEALTGNVGEPYETQPAEIDGYELIETPDNATGEFTEEPQTVTYVYAPLENPATVTVEHVDEDGNELAPSEALTGNVGEPYETQPAEIDGYELIETPDNATGEFTEEPQTVTYVYAPAETITPFESVIVVEHVDQEGNLLENAEPITGNIGEPYETSPKDIDDYELIETPNNATGEFTEEPQTVIYVYAPVDEETAHVTVEHVDEDGNELIPPEELLGIPGNPYEAHPENIGGYELIETPDNAAGEFKDQPQMVTYVYTPVEGDPEGTIIIEYVNKEGNPISNRNTEAGLVGDPYESSPKDMDGYELIETPDNATGEFTDEPQTITYVYAPVEKEQPIFEGAVVFTHVDQDGNPLASPETITELVGDPYESSPKDMDGYELIETPANAIGKFTNETQIVTYIYAPVEEPTPGAPVQVDYVDQNGNPIIDSEELTGNIGDPYQTQPKEIDGYELVEIPNNETGEFGENPQTVTYVYAPVEEPTPGAPVQVDYVDQNGNPIIDSEELTGNIGDPYQTQPKEIDGYELVEIPNNETGEFGENPQTVTYVYAPVEEPTPGAPVQVDYVDQNGNPIIDSEELTGSIGDPYQTQPKEIDGYELVEIPNNETGEFGENPQTVTYVYAPVEEPTPGAPVQVDYVDQNGNPIIDSEELTGNIGDPYQTQPKEIDGYELVEIPNNETGEFGENPQTVTYVYAPIEEPTPGAPVQVDYVDQNGNPIIDSEELTGNIGDPYQTQPKEIDGYELVEIPNNETGEFGENPQTVTYVYAPVEEPTPGAPVQVDYVDQNGNPIIDSEELTGNIGDPYQTQPKEIDGYELVEIPNNETGEFGENPQTVTYVYKKISSSGSEIVRPGTENGGTDNDQTLPNTSTNIYNLLVLGLILVAFGAIVSIVQRRRKVS